MADRPARVAVVGGGVAGLAAAWELAGRRSRGEAVEVCLVEADERLGGRLAAAEFAGRTVDLAADAFLARRPEAVDLVGELGLDGELVPPGASGASVWARGRLRALPAALQLGVPTRWWPLARSGILSPGEAAVAAADLLRPHRHPEFTVGDRSVGELVAGRLGRPVVERLVDPLVGGIHAGCADELSAAAVFPLLLAAAQQPGSLMRRLRRVQPPAETTSPLFLSLRSSTATLAAGLARALPGRGVAVRLATRVDAVARSPAASGGPRFTLTLRTAGPDGSGAPTLGVDAVVLALPAREAAVLLAPLAPTAAGLLSGLEYASVATLTLLVPKGAVAGRRGTGFLVPRTSDLDGRAPLVTACTFLDRKWPHLERDDGDLVRLSVGRRGDERPDRLDDAELVGAASAELGRMLASPTLRPAHALVTRWPGAFPQYAVGHLLRVAMVMEDVASVGGLAVAGAAYRGVGIPACIASGREAAGRALASIATGGYGPAPGDGSVPVRR